MILNLTEEEKMTIWLEYVSSICSLNNFPLEISLHKHLDDTWTKYPQLGVATKLITTKHKIRDFESFSNETDSGVSEGLIGRYWRFHNKK